MSPQFLAGLNEPQLEAVTLPPQSALILAGAGSGKTRVLTTRIAWLIQTGQVSPHGLLAVTFTNKAAKEMLTRISAMLPINTRGMWVGTFHGLCNRMLRTHSREAGLPSLFQILDTQDQLALVKRIMKSMNLDEELYPPRQATWFIAAQQGRRAAPEGRRALRRLLRSAWSRSTPHTTQQCQREGVVDFAELLLRSYELLSRNETLREHYRNRFRHILVDEFQDTNKLQYRWLQLLAGQENTIFAVGDDDQSIYAFRGANTANMQHLQRDFHIERVIKLEQNYRSHAHILDAANALIGHNRKRLGKNLWTSEGKGEPLRVYEAATDLDEASLHRRGSEIAARPTACASARSRCSTARTRSRACSSTRFSTRRCRIASTAGLRFFERQEIKHALAYLRLVANADDDGAFLRIVNFPTRGIGARSIEQIQEVSRGRGITLWAAACANTLSGKAAASIAGFVRLIENMRAGDRRTAAARSDRSRHRRERAEAALQERARRRRPPREPGGAGDDAAASFIAEREAQPLDEGVDELDDLTAFLVARGARSRRAPGASPAPTRCSS